ncbi:hypothetical protein ACJX0J_013277, partial [Zea mays]
MYLFSCENQAPVILHRKLKRSTTVISCHFSNALKYGGGGGGGPLRPGLTKIFYELSLYFLFTVKTGLAEKMTLITISLGQLGLLGLFSMFILMDF